MARAQQKKTESYRWFWDALDAYLARKNLKQTKQRKQIVELFIGLQTHLSAEELHEAARKDGQSVGLATIYRTLNLLADAGLAEQKSFGENRQVYEINMPGQHHDHLICIGCGDVIEFENEEIERLQDKVAAQHGFKLMTHRLDMFGYCKKDACTKQAKIN